MKKKLFLIFVFTFIVYLLSSGGATPFNYFTRLADAFLHARFYLTDNPPWLSELIPAGANKFYVVYPLMPAILAIPFVAIFGPEFPQQILAHALGAGIVVLTIELSLGLCKNKKIALWSGLLVGFGSIVWYLSSVGSSWYLGQITAAFFLIAAITETLGKKRIFLVGFLIGCAYLSRIHTILSLPFFIYTLNLKPKKKIDIAKFVLRMLFILILDFTYNFLRFGVVFNKGYLLIPGVLSEPWFSKGILSLSYIKNNLLTAFWSFPNLLIHPPFIQPSWGGLSIWITTPAFVYSLLAKISEKIVLFSWFSIFIIFGFVLMHGSNGFTQFGYRFAVDFYPFLILLTIKGTARNGLKWHHWLLLLISIIVNAWGVIFINKFGWVSF